jgi:riboflavin kinase/FMN adenylyltransferase
MGIVASTGFFDGVHLGHAKVIETLVERARKDKCTSVVVTFWPHPRNVLRQDASRLRLLTSLREKEALLYSMGVDKVVVIDFTKQLSTLTAEEFIKEHLIKELDVETMIVGYDHRIGSKSIEKKGDDLCDVCNSLGLNAIKVSAVSDEFGTISSTYIRHLIQTGGIERANTLLGYRYGLEGVVVSGRGMGKKIGYPTANIQLYEPLKLIPENGVYAIMAEVEGVVYKGVCNIGIRPTFSDGDHITIESNLLDFDENIYGLTLKIEFVGRIRDEKCFSSLTMLQEQLAKDTKCARELLKDIDVKQLR